MEKNVEFAVVDKFDNQFAKEGVLPSEPWAGVVVGVVLVERFVHKAGTGVGAHQHLNALTNLGIVSAGECLHHYRHWPHHVVTDMRPANSLTGIAAEIVRIPDKKVKIESLSNNINLEFVDTVGKDSCISLIDQNSFFGSPRYSMRQSWYNTGNGTNITESVKDTPDKCVYTKICIEKGCTTLAHTFDKNIVLNTKYSSSTGKLYKNIWGQNVYNNPIRIQDAKYFINTIVQGGVQGDYYIDENNIIHSSYNGKTYGEDCSMDIISLQGCFKNQKEK